MKSDKGAIKNTQKEANIDDIADLKTDLDDMMADNSKMQTRIVNEGQEELPEDLEALEVEAAELEAMDLAAHKQIESQKKAGKILVEEQKEEEDEDEVEPRKLMLS